MPKSEASHLLGRSHRRVIRKLLEGACEACEDEMRSSNDSVTVMVWLEACYGANFNSGPKMTRVTDPSNRLQAVAAGQMCSKNHVNVIYPIAS